MLAETVGTGNPTTQTAIRRNAFSWQTEYNASMEMNFCRRCGTSLTASELPAYTCEHGHTIFANAAPTTGIFFVTEDNQVHLSVRGIEPHKGMLDAFGGFVDGAETLEVTVARELTEELGLQPGDYTTPEYLTSGVGHYPFGGEILPVVSAFFWSRLLVDSVIPRDDVAAIATYPLADVPLDKLHDQDIVAGIKALQAKLLS